MLLKTFPFDPCTSICYISLQSQKLLKFLIEIKKKGNIIANNQNKRINR